MSTVSPHDADEAASPTPHTGRWRLPSGRSATAHVRRTIHAALQRWGLGSAADTLTNQMTALIQELSTRFAASGSGPLDLRLELRTADRLLLGEIHDTTRDRSEPDDRTLARHPEPRRGIIALTYGRRPARNGTATWYTHTFTWFQPDELTTDR
ncbi:hypothetical protein [Actinomadura sp. 6N118]|uniref:hypothetical protein n=1 Tax=Actinomadura sp. 6N118 TaxID=3375151 RepID=UPI0037938E6B